MGKGRPSPRETAKEKETKPQKAASAKASAKKAGAGRPEPKKPLQSKAGKPVAEKEKSKSVGREDRPARTEKVSLTPAATPAEVMPAKPAESIGPKSQPHEPAIQKAAVREPEVKPAPVPGREVQPDELDGVRLPAAGGKVGVFGGPKDRSVKPDDKLGLPTGRHYQFEQFRSLNPKGYYCAMRWEYRQQHMSSEEGKRWWANKRIAVTNPANNKSVVVRAVDYGPHENTGLTIAISPGAAEAIGVEPGQEVVVAFADEKAQLGPATATPGGGD